MRRHRQHAHIAIRATLVSSLHSFAAQEIWVKYSVPISAKNSARLLNMRLRLNVII